MTCRPSVLTASLALAVLSAGAPLHSQTAEGRLAGVVRDASGATVPGATITVANQATSATKAATSAADGSYALSLAAGHLLADGVTRKGFARQVRKDVKVEPGATPTADFALEARSRRRSRSPP